MGFEVFGVGVDGGGSVVDGEVDGGDFFFERGLVGLENDVLGAPPGAAGVAGGGPAVEAAVLFVVADEGGFVQR